MKKNTNASAYGMHGIAWMTFTIVMALAFFSPSMRVSVDQVGRNTFSAIELRKKNLEDRSSPVESWNDQTFGPIQRALNEAPSLKEPVAERTPSQVGALN